MLINKIKKILMNPRILIIYLLNLKFARLINDSLFLKIKFRLLMNKKLDFDNPKSFNEKLQWLKLYDRDESYVDLVDKLKVREHIKNIIGEEYLIPLLGEWDKFEDIDFSKLPEEFVLKPNHTSGDIYICRSKSNIDLLSLNRRVNFWLKREYFWFHREWPYKNIKPKILCEEFIKDNKYNELIDYKFFCFNGEPKCLFIGTNRHMGTGLNVDFYDLNWNLLPFTRHYKNSGKSINKPINFDKMIEFSKILAKDKVFVRVDFYEANGKLFFGEITFYPGSGYEEFNPEEYDYLLGSWIHLPTI